MISPKSALITGAAGSGGSYLAEFLLEEIKLDQVHGLVRWHSTTSLNNLSGISDQIIQHECDLLDLSSLVRILQKVQPDIIFHLAAESHVDRSIINPEIFIKSNILGTFNLLQASKLHWEKLNSKRKKSFKFHHISTDEVFGTLMKNGKFNENTKYDPRSPYSASKASSDHLVNAWFHTFNFPVITTNCSNNYGPYQFPEKLIPLAILKAYRGEKIPLYGDGSNIRDWLYIDDHLDAITLVAEKGKLGKSYCIGGFGERSNKEVLFKICNLMDEYKPKNYSHSNLIENVEDRPGHDQRYAIDSTLIQKELSWMPKTNFDEGLSKTIKWYLNNLDWCELVLEKSGYDGRRLGT